MSELVIVQARLGSTRLRNKVLMHIGEKPCLWHVMERVKLAGYPYILTIPDAPSDDALALYAEEQGWPLSRGPHPDMLAAFIKAWEDAGSTASVIVRVTADCPFVQPDAIRQYGTYCNWYVSNAHPVRRVPKGLDVEVFAVPLLAMANRHAVGPDREHVTPWMRRYFDFATSTDDGEFRVTLDTPGDLATLREIARSIDTTPPHPTLEELRDYFRARY